MINNLKTISKGNVQFIKNEEIIADKKLAIEVWDRDIYQKKRVNLDVQAEIQNLLTYIELEDLEIAKRVQTIENKNEELLSAQAEFEELKLELAERQQTILELGNQIAEIEQNLLLQQQEEERRRLEEEARLRQLPKPKQKYIPIKGDKVDEKMATYINDFALDVPFHRIGEGQYMFGSRKIFAKIMNDKLVIRVGGGYMVIDEFLQTYGTMEMEKIEGKNAAKPAQATGRGSPNA